MVDSVIAKIEAQQKGKKGTAPWMVGEQLKDICRNEPACAELVDKDLDIKEMSISECEKKIKAFADKNKISKLIIYPDYKKYGKFAPLKRNEKMVELADTVIIVWDGKSKGTKYTIEYAKKRNKKITLLSP